MQFYTDPSRESLPTSLPDAEVFHSSDLEAHQDGEAEFMDDQSENERLSRNPGWYWWPCLPDCLPDGDPIGPFATEVLAIADARSQAADDAGAVILDGSKGFDSLCPNARLIIDHDQGGAS